MYIYNTNTVCMQGGDEDGEGGGSDIGALLGNLGPLISGLSGVSRIFNTVYMTLSIVQPLGTVRPLYRTGVSLLSRERFSYI